MSRRPAIGTLLSLFCALAPSLSHAQYVHDALNSGDLICEFHDGFRRDLVADLRFPRRGADMMLIFESIRVAPLPAAGTPQETSGTAFAFSSRVPGKRQAIVRTTPNAVHFIERVGPSVRVTTLSACEQWKFRRGVETCVRFGAQHAWHFDTLAQRIPDTSFARQPSGGARGSCEPWQVD